MHPALNAARVVVVTREGCHLCDEALVAVDTVCQELNISWQAVDVDADPSLRRDYTDHVPVTFVDGVQHALWFVDAGRLRDALA
ncbi:MAG: glutaredoxin family protein [Propionibacteriaceae bacterium]|nr:glutaredoxin family protein [Propionibacteriaceae bacterium]